MTHHEPRSTYVHMALATPDRLLAILQGRTSVDPPLPDYELTFAAEAGDTLEGPEAAGALIALLYHPSPLVREGAIYGLNTHGADPRVRPALLALSASDANATIRECAREMFASFSEDDATAWEDEVK